MTLADIDADLIEPQRLAESVIDQLKVESRKPPKGKPPGIASREALLAVRFEAQLVGLAAENLAHGIALTDTDRARLLVAWARIDFIYTEVAR